MNGTEITFIERQRIELRLRAKYSIRNIGKALKRNHSVISREIARNKKPDGSYSAVYAEKQAQKRRVRRGNVKRKLDKDEHLRNYVVSELKRGKAPDVIAGRMKLLMPPELKGSTISHEAIYGWLQIGAGNKLGYWQYLPTKRQRRRHHGSRKKQGKTSIPGRISIHGRDEGINDRMTLGHWETDSIIYPGSRGQILSVQTERKARYTMIHRLPSKTAKDTLSALRETISSVPQDLIQSITFDNGSEGARHQTLKNDYNIQTYFCDPYSSWQKGTVEQTNGIIRRYLPRGTDLRTVTNKQIYEIQEKLNNTPRKILNYKTPKEVLFDLPPQVVH